MADFLLAAWFAWMTPLDAALSSLVDAFFRASWAAPASPASAASRNLRIQVRSSLLTALLRSVRFSLVLMRFSCCLMFATWEVLSWLERMRGGGQEEGRRRQARGAQTRSCAYVRSAHAAGQSTSGTGWLPKRQPSCRAALMLRMA